MMWIWVLPGRASDVLPAQSGMLATVVKVRQESMYLREVRGKGGEAEVDGILRWSEA